MDKSDGVEIEATMGVEVAATVEPINLVPAVDATSTLVSISRPEDEKVEIWSGILKWYGHEEGMRMINQNTFDWDRTTETTTDMPCTFYSQVVQGSLEVPSTLESEKVLGLHLIRKSRLKQLDLKYLQDTKNIKLSIQSCPARAALVKLLRSGRYAGCIHLAGDEPVVSSAGIGQLTKEMGVIILLYSRGKQSTIGFVPNDMKEFVEKLCQVIPDHESTLAPTSMSDFTVQQGDQKQIQQSSSTCLLQNQAELMAKSHSESETEAKQEDDQLMDVEIPIRNYWTYEICQNFKPPNHLAISSFEPNKQHKKDLNFFKGCKWAPDGSCLISNSDDDILRLYNVPESLYGVADWGNYQGPENVLKMDSVLQVKEGGQVYDYCWYPVMSSYDPVSCCFLTTTADAPVHLWDAFTGQLRASYIGYDHLDQVVAARSIAFDSTGGSIICGFDTLIRIFDITRPGRECIERKLKHSQLTELSQPGIVSCIAVNPALKSVLAIGSYLKTVGLYHDDGSVLCILQGHLGGVTHLQFSHDGTKLFSGGRKDSRLICWDMRYMGEQYTIYDRAVTTNQRIYFDITTNRKYLISGGTDGEIKIWDLSQASAEPEPYSTFQANSDCVNGVSINPFIPLLATSSGQRRVCKVNSNFSDDEDSDSDSAQFLQKEERDVKLWKFNS